MMNWLLTIHMPQYDIGWTEDNAIVFSILLSVLQTSSYLTSLKGYQKSGNGSEAWKNLILHNLGNSVWDNRTTAAENKVLKKIFDGKITAIHFLLIAIIIGMRIKRW